MLTLIVEHNERFKKQTEGGNIDEVSNYHEGSSTRANSYEVKSDNKGSSYECEDVNDNKSSIDPFKLWGEDPD